MKITDVRPVLLTGPSTNDPFLSKAQTHRSAAFIEIHTDTEFMGLGETYAGCYCPDLVPVIVEQFKDILIGRDISNIEQLWNDMYQCHNFWCRVGAGAIVLTGIEAALWDLKGKMLGLPVYELLGGLKHEKLLGYATGGPCNYPKDELAKKMDHYLSLGFNAFKISAGSFDEKEGWYGPRRPNDAAEYEVDKMEFIRKHVGKDIEVLMDAHMGNSPFHTWDLQTAISVLKALEPYNLFLFEEALHYTDPWGYAELCKNTTIPVAGGECLTTTYEWKLYIEKGCFDVGQPDAAFSGGLGEFMKISQLLDAQGGKVATHSWGAGGALMQNIHLGFACRNTVILEMAPDYGPLHQEVIGDRLQMKDGYVLPPNSPGLGIELKESTKEKFPFIPNSGWYNFVPGKPKQKLRGNW